MESELETKAPPTISEQIDFLKVCYKEEAIDHGRASRVCWYLEATIKLLDSCREQEELKVVNA